MKKILGIDPGSLNLGYGVVIMESHRIRHIEHGIIRLPKSLNFEKRLVELGVGLSELMARLRPEVAVVEKIFLGKNPQSAFQLGHARGVCLYEAVRAGLVVAEYTPREVKQGIAGNGAASKELVCQFMQNLLRIDLDPAAGLDSSDALALAYHHARQLESPVSAVMGRF